MILHILHGGVPSISKMVINTDTVRSEIGTNIPEPEKVIQDILQGRLLPGAGDGGGCEW